MNKNKKLGCLSLLLMSPLSLAMQPLDDSSLSATTAQDGLTVEVQMQNAFQFDQITMIDNDGFEIRDENNTLIKSYGQRGALVIARQGATPVSVQGLNASSQEIPLYIKAVMDADAGTGTDGALANIAVSFGNLAGIRISPLSFYIASNAQNSEVLSTIVGTTYTAKSIFDNNDVAKAGVKELLRVNNNLDIKFTPSKSPTMNIQLGATPQGQMIRFGGALDSICGTGTGCNMMLVSDYTTPTDSTSTPIGLSFDLQLKANNQTNGFSLNGFYAGIQNDGLVFGNEGTTDKFDLSINKIQMGTGSSSIQFNGLSNGSIGNIGMVGAKIDNFQMKVSGM